MENILITGSTGFVGSELQNIFKESSNYQIYRVVRRKDLVKSKFDTFVPNIDDKTNWDGLLDNIDIIIHLAAKVHDMDFKENHNPNNDFFKINSLGTKRLVEDAGKKGIKKVIFLSTIKAIGESKEGIIFNENMTPNPMDSYGKSKLKAENYIIEYSKLYGFKYVIIRPTLVFGENAKGNLKVLMKFASLGIPFPYFKRENKRSMIGLNNLCDLIRYAVENESLDNEVIIASEKDILSTKDLLYKISKQMNKNIIFLKMPMFISCIIKKIGFLNKVYIRLYGDLLVDNTKLYNITDWVPPYTIDQQIKKMTDYYLKNKKEK